MVVKVLSEGTQCVAGLLNLYGFLATLHNLLNEACGQLERQIGKPICIEGCGLCCHRAVPIVSTLEVAYIAGYLPSMRLSDSVIARAFQWLEDENPELIDAAHPVAHERLQRQVSLLQTGRCPFVSETAECLIHKIRPLSCRAYGVTSPSNCWCRRPLSGRESETFCLTIDAETPIGVQIRATVGALWLSIDHYRMQHLKLFGLLPSLLAELVDPQSFKRLSEAGLIHPAKLAKGVGKCPDLFNMDSPERPQ